MHTCPECGQACCCNGDIDDCLNDFEEDVMDCTCCFDNPEDYYGEDDPECSIYPY